MAKLADQFTAFLGLGKKKDVKDVKTKFDRLGAALQELKESLNEVNVASDLCADAVTQATVNSDAITQADVIDVLPPKPQIDVLSTNSQNGINRVFNPGLDSSGGRKSRRGGRKSRRGGRKSRRGGRKSRRGGRKSRRAGRKSRRGGRKSRRAGRKSRRAGKKSRRGGNHCYL